jgi:coenzyme F420 hydrogenase subunit beta
MSIEGLSETSPKERLDRISECGLCIGCGLCQSVAGPEVVRMAVTSGGDERPVVCGDLDHQTVDLIYDVCPGTRVEGLPTRLIEEATHQNKIWGPYREMVMAYAADPEVRFRAATGGVLTALALYLLHSGQVDFILHVKASNERPSFGERHISRLAADVITASGSRYGPTAVLSDMESLLELNKPFAFVGKPCDIAALRNLARHDNRVDALVRYWLTPVCGGFMPSKDLREFLGEQGIEFQKIHSLSYRGYGCPGPTRIEMTDGQVIEKNYLDMWEDASSWSLPFRCKICPDGIGEGADIAAADTWPGGSPTWEGQKTDKGTNAVIVRTAAGQALIKAAAAEGFLVVEDEIGPDELSDFQPHQVAKKYASWARHLGLRTSGQLAPETERLRIRELAEERKITELLLEARGTRKRVMAGKTREPAPAFVKS